MNISNLNKKKASRGYTSSSSGSPNANEGFDGDITVRHTELGPSMFIKSNGTWFSVKLNNDFSQDKIPGISENISDLCLANNFPALRDNATFKASMLSNTSAGGTVSVRFKTNKVWCEITENTNFVLYPPNSDRGMGLAATFSLVISHQTNQILTMVAKKRSGSNYVIKWPAGTGIPPLTSANTIDVYNFLYIVNNDGTEHWLGAAMKNFS